MHGQGARSVEVISSAERIGVSEVKTPVAEAMPVDDSRSRLTMPLP